MIDDPNEHLNSVAESIRAQLADFQSLRQRIEAVEAEAQSSDRAVRVRVNSSGMILDITLAQSTERMHRAQLARLIAETAQAAAYRATDLVHQQIQSVTDAQQQLHRAMEAADPRVASALGGGLTVSTAGPPGQPAERVPPPQSTPWQRPESQRPRGNATPTEPQSQQRRPTDADEDAHFDRFNIDPLGWRGYNNQ